MNSRRAAGRLIWIAFVAAAAAAAVNITRRPPDPLRRVADAAPGRTRAFPARLSGIEWSPADPSRQSAALNDVAAALLRDANADASPRIHHAAALAQLLRGDAADAESRLSQLAPRANDPRLWSDLAAARLTIGVRNDDAAELAQALAAADAALQLDRDLVEAQFNRALIIEQLGLRDQARDEWKSYLQLDPQSRWADEGRAHLQTLQSLRPFGDELARNYDRLAADPPAAHAFAREYPQEARTWGETEILGRWAIAERANDHALAAKHLCIARELGAELVRFHGDQMLTQLVQTIDHTNDEQRTHLVAAHILFRDGQKAFQNDRVLDAERMLTNAATEFDRGKSPGALLARYFVANAAYSQGHRADARKKLEALLAGARPTIFIAHRAQLQWELGLVYFAESRWGACIDALTDSVAGFERLGELEYGEFVREILAEAYDRIGDPATAWKHRRVALRQLGKRPSWKQHVVIASMSRAEAMNEQWPAALAFMGLEIDLAPRINDRVLRTETLLLRSRVHLRMRHRSAAAADLGRARIILTSLADPAYRTQLAANAAIVDALLMPDRKSAAEMLTRTIEFERSGDRRLFLPELLLERGRAFRDLGDRSRAAADFEAGIAELETNRDSLAEGEARWGIFHAAGNLFEEAVTLALARQDVNAAFHYVERARARALLDALGASWPQVDLAEIPSGTTIIEYAVQSSGLLIFVVDERGIRSVRSHIDLQTVAELRNAAIANDHKQLTRAGRLLDRQLIEPVRNELTPGRRLVIVGDPAMSGLPFNALVDDNGKFLIERHTLSFAPSAAVFVRLVRRASMPRNVLVANGEARDLAAVRAESALVAATYPRATTIQRGDAFLRAAVNADVIHFAGHASRGFLELDDGRIDQHDIAAIRLPRTSCVILAACDTAAGESRSTEGTISVARAFLAAGAPAVIATLWPVDDQQSARFFPAVHKRLAQGIPPAQALREVQLEWIRKPDSPASLWAAVQVFGN